MAKSHSTATRKEKDPLNFVHQNAILCETIMKEQRHQKLYKNYSVNPFKKSKYAHQCRTRCRSVRNREIGS